MVEKRTRIIKVVKHPGGGVTKHVFVASGDAAVGEIGVDVDVNVEKIDVGDLIEESEEDGTWVMKIKLPKDAAGPDPLARAAGMSGAIENLEGEISALVRRAREQGYSWTDIGNALGTSKQAAWERFSGED